LWARRPAQPACGASDYTTTSNRWMHGYQTALDRKQPRAVPRRGPALELWREEHDRLGRELADAEAERAAARSALQQANADATATAAAAAAAAARPLPHPLRHAHDEATGCGAGYADAHNPTPSGR
jgi:hypothetical protein